MCEHYIHCQGPPEVKRKPRAFNLLLLDCWQREYDKRPYRNFRFSRKDFEERLGRAYNSTRDFVIIVKFLETRVLCSAIFQGFRICTEKSQWVDDFVRNMHRLSHIEFRLMTLPSMFFEALLRHVDRLRVRFLSFEGTPLTELHLHILREFLIQSKRLEFINLSHCSITQFLFPIIADGMHKSTSLKGFNCSRLLGGKAVCLQTTDIAHLVSSLIWQNKLVEIEMQMCEFIAHDMIVFGEYMADKCCKLRKLNLACNKLAADGAEYLFRYIAESNTLTHLNISTNDLGPHGGNVVWKYLTSCKMLKFLDISYNDIDASAINQLLVSFKKPIKVLKLKLWGNQFDHRSAMILKRLLDARVLSQDMIDITVTPDDDQYRIVPWK